MMQFYLPVKFNKDSIPNPLDEEVKVVKIDGGYFAVLKYSGKASDDNFIKYKNILQKELIKNDISIKNFPIRATYNSPFTLPIFRRNEVMFEIDYK